VATIAGLIVLIPGLTLTTAMSELATRHLASGTARLSGTFITFLGIAFGVALGNRIGAAAFGVPPSADPALLPAWASLVALVAAPLSFVVILRAEPSEAAWIVAAAASAPRRWASSSAPSRVRWRWRSRAACTSGCGAGPPRWCWCRGFCCWCQAASGSEASPP
jgi:hypothetical protein